MFSFYCRSQESAEVGMQEEGAGLSARDGS